MTAKTTRTVVALLLGIMLLSAGSAVLAQEDAAPAEAKQDKNAELAKDWTYLLHYIKVARPKPARSHGESILESGADPRALYHLSAESPDSLSVLARGSRLKGMKEIVERIRAMIEKGAQAERSDPKQIARWIGMLGGSVRQYQIALKRLVESGEYALPQLLKKLRDTKTSDTLRENIISVLPKLGKEGVRGMSVALQTREPQLREILANALGDIEYPHAAPRLKELLGREGVLERTQRVVKLSLVSCAGAGALDKSTAQLYYDQALKYYYQAESVAPDPRYADANVWYWKEIKGEDGVAFELIFRPVPREIFCDIYAMRMARLALEHDPKFYPAYSLWMAAYLKREADLPTGRKDPLLSDDTLSAGEFALASSARYLQQVLWRALRDRNSAVALGAIRQLARTTGARNLVKPVAGGATPLVEALRYPEKRVRYLAALSLARALPDKRFNGSQLVIPVLRETLRQSGKKTVLLIVADVEKRNALKDAIRKAGCRVIDEANPVKAFSAARDSAGVDVAVLTDEPDAVAVVARLRKDASFAAIPVVIASGAKKATDLAARDKRVVVIPASADADRIGEALNAAGKLAAGAPMETDEATEWAVKAAEAVRLMGLTRNSVYDISRLEGTLIETLDDERGEVRVAVAEALATMNSAAAQCGIAKLANKSEVDEKVRVAVYAALSESIRKYGNQLTDTLAEEVRDVVSGAPTGAIRQAASQALGAMNLPSEKIIQLMTSQAEKID